MLYRPLLPEAASAWSNPATLWCRFGGCCGPRACAVTDIDLGARTHTTARCSGHGSCSTVNGPLPAEGGVQLPTSVRQWGNWPNSWRPSRLESCQPGALGGVPARRPSTGAGPDDEVGTVAEHQLLVRVQSSSIKLPRRLRGRVGLQAVAMRPITAAASRRAGQCCVRLRDPCCTWLIGRTHRSRKQESQSSTSPANHSGLTCSTSSTRILPDILLWFPRASPG